jgi:hypothetical protein
VQIADYGHREIPAAALFGLPPVCFLGAAALTRVPHDYFFFIILDNGS